MCLNRIGVPGMNESGVDSPIRKRREDPTFAIRWR